MVFCMTLQNFKLIGLPVQLPSAESAEEHVAPPEFGFSSAPTTGDKQNTLLTWQAMRQVGAGFWLTDSQVCLYRPLAEQQACLKDLLFMHCSF